MGAIRILCILAADHQTSIEGGGRMRGPIRWLRQLGSLAAAAVCVAAMAASGPQAALAAGGGAGLKPAMGWSSWSYLRGGASEQIVVTQAQAMHSTVPSHGYTDGN